MRNPLMMLTLSLLLSMPATADWKLDPLASSLSFVTVKNAAVSEAHRFIGLAGHVDESGAAELRLNMTSFDTLIPIRNERMQSMLFESSKYPEARFSVKVPVKEIKTFKRGESRSYDLEGVLHLHGAKADVVASVQVVRVDKSAYVVSTIKPVILNAADFHLMGGIEKLRAVAGLQSIAPSVPVTFSLMFRR